MLVAFWKCYRYIAFANRIIINAAGGSEITVVILQPLIGFWERQLGFGESVWEY